MNYNEIISLVYEARKFVFDKSARADVKEKNPLDFVTAVDTGISDFLKEKLYELYPDVGFVTEEEPGYSDRDKVFILDPIDGTTNLVYGYKKSSISLAYAEGGAVMFGVVYDPYSSEIFFAVRGKGAHYYNARGGILPLLEIGVENYKANILSVSSRPMREAIVEFGASSSKKNMAEETFSRARRVFEKCLDLRRICSTALSISYIAAGRIDGYFEKHIKPWDYAAAILLLEEAGGVSSNWQGAPLPLDTPGTIIAASREIYEELRNLL